MDQHEIYILRCLELAKLGSGNVSPNPLVGAVLVYNNQIIGEGWHQEYGKAHAEVNCINSVSLENVQYIQNATLYVSLEPCNHFGKTPPCSHLIVEKQIKKVVIGCKDTNSVVNGSGIKYLKDNGVTVIENVLEEECKKVNAIFFENQKSKMPFITLKWAQSSDGFMNALSQERTLITNAWSNRFVHKIRSEHDAILVGSNTVKIDNPSLTNRYYGLKQPKIIIIDRNLALENHYILFKSNTPIFILNTQKEELIQNVHFLKIQNDGNFLENGFKRLMEFNISSILVEGGAMLLNTIISKGLYHKIIRITNETLFLNAGLNSPEIKNIKQIEAFNIGTDKVEIYN